MNNLLAQDAATPLADSTTRLLPLNKGKFALVDDADFEWLSQWNWTANYDKRCNKWYAYRRGPRSEGHKYIAMHRLIINAPRGVLVDHKDLDGLNNQKSNLRLADKSQNACNTGRRRDNTSGYKGVYWHTVVNKWHAEIQVRGKRIHIGHFDSKESASQAYTEAARLNFGEFFRA